VSTPEPFSTLWHSGRLCHNYHARAREGNSDKFGHENCAILRESALRQF
jgi:hypothetical protein